jgi:hypothetical protein
LDEEQEEVIVPAPLPAARVEDYGAAKKGRKMKRDAVKPVAKVPKNTTVATRGSGCKSTTFCCQCYFDRDFPVLRAVCKKCFKNGAHKAAIDAELRVNPPRVEERDSFSRSNPGIVCHDISAKKELYLRKKSTLADLPR